jgi:hypothetical protein
MKKNILTEELKRMQELAGIILEAKMEDLYDKYFSDIPREDFDKIINTVPDISKERNDYKGMRVMSNWLINLYRKGSLKIEDLYKAKEYLTLYYRNINDLLKNNNADIKLDNYKDLPSLFNLVRDYKGSEKPDSVEDEKELITNKYFLNNGQAEKIYEDSAWLVVSPKTLEASKFYGCTSEWCTLFPDMFNTYSSQGPLYIIIDKNNLNNTMNPNRRYQFHFESEQYMNMDDLSISGGEIDYDDSDYENEDFDFLGRFSPNLVTWYLDNKRETEGGLDSYDMKYLPEDELYNMAIKRYKKHSGNLGLDFIVNLKNDTRRNIVTKLFLNIKDFLLNPSFVHFVSKEIRKENKNRIIKNLENHIVNTYVNNNYKKNNFSWSSGEDDEDLKYLKEIVRILKKYFSDNPEKYNKVFSEILLTTTSSHNYSNELKSFIYNNISKDYPFYYNALNDEDKKKHFLRMIELNKINQNDLQQLKNLVGKKEAELFNEKILKKVIEDGPKEKNRLSKYVLRDLNSYQQMEYVKAFFDNFDGLKMNFLEWSSLKEDVKEELKNTANDKKYGLDYWAVSKFVELDNFEKRDRYS